MTAMATWLRPMTIPTPTILVAILWPQQFVFLSQREIIAFELEFAAVTLPLTGFTAIITT
jgi:hypothetical protein